MLLIRQVTDITYDLRINKCELFWYFNLDGLAGVKCEANWRKIIDHI